MDDPTMPDLSHLSAEEREIIENVLKRQRDEEAKETQISQKADEELDQIDRQINERKESARRLVGTQDDAICQICQKTKFADGIGHKCFYCQLRSCARCGGRAQSKNKAIWACSLCQKRQQILAKTGKWFQQEVPPKPSSPCAGQPSTSAETPTLQTAPQQPQIICPPTNNGPLPRQTNGPQALPPQQQQNRGGPVGPMSNGPNGPNMRKQNTLTRQPTLEEQRNQTIQQPNGRLKSMDQSSQQRNRMQDSMNQPMMNQGDMRSRSRQEEPRAIFTVNSSEDNGYQHQSFNQPQPSPSFQQGYQQGFQQPGYQEQTVSFGQQNQQTFRDQRASTSTKTSQPQPTAVPAAVPPATPVGGRTQPEFRRTRSIREEEGRRGSIGLQMDHQSTVATTSSTTTNRIKKEKRLHRQLRSMSSSDDEALPSTSAADGGFVDSARQRLPDECNSERDLLRYIYSGDKIKNGRKAGQTRPLFGSVEPGGGRPAVPPAVIPGEQLAAKIRTYLSHPVTWQPSADQKFLIGHMVLSRTGEDNGDLGLKVVGGRRTDTGRLGAFITRVRPGSVADTVGRLKAGDEVLEWNGTQLQNATYDQVYETISKSKNDSQIDLIVSRSAWRPGGDDFLQIHRSSPYHHPVRHLPNPQFVQDYSEAELYGASVSPIPQLPHSQSAYLPGRMAATYYQPEVETYGRGTIFGKIEIACFYSHSDRQLTVMIERAFDLAPRPDGVARNPYVKVFLLPDRSEYSRRQTAVIAESLCPIWGESFFYNQLSEPALFERALEVTVWDYDKLDSNAFLGEVLIDFSTVPLDGAPMLFTLTDMDDENPLRTRLRQRKMSQYSSVPQRLRDEGPPRPHSEMASYGYNRSRPPARPERATQQSSYADGYDAPMRRSRTYDRYGAKHEERYGHHSGYHTPHTPNMPEEDWTSNQPSGYLSDHAHSHQPRHRHRRPRSATAMRHLTAAEMGASRMYPRAPIDDWDDVATPESARGPTLHHARDPRSPNGRVLMETMHEQQGYGSDGSETLSIHSQHSNPVIQTINRRPRPGPSVMPDPMPDMEEYPEEVPLRRHRQEAGGGGHSSKDDSGVAMKERKKSLMTRFIPGRAGEAGSKRTGFARSEEVGIPENLSADRLPAMLKQTSKESTDSGDNFLPVLPDGQLGPFVDNLGPGQVVGRQVLASSPHGELKIAIMGGRGGIEVEIIQALNLVVKHGSKMMPALYVKVYLMEGKTCISKAKTNPVRSNSTSPMIRQRLHFHENPRKKMLQIMVLGDHGRMERKQFIGIAQIRLDDLELGAQPVTGTYKLYPTSSLAGMTPVRKDSETSLTGPQS